MRKWNRGRNTLSKLVQPTVPSVPFTHVIGQSLFGHPVVKIDQSDNQRCFLLNLVPGREEDGEDEGGADGRQED